MSPEKAVKEAKELSVEERVALLKQSFAGHDGKSMAENTNQFSIAMMAAHKESPDLASESFPAIEAAFADIDFGKLREAVIAMLDYGTAIASKSLEEMLDNPVVVANIVGMLPAMVNSLLDIVSALLDNLELPPEILASALFNVLTAVDAEKLGHVLTEVSKQVNLLHAGNYILGGDEPRARAVTKDIANRLLEALDVDVFVDMLIALGEDAEVVAAALVALFSRDPALVDALARASVGLTNIVARILSSMMSEAADWPAEALMVLGKEGRVLDAAEFGRVIDSFVTYALRLRDANPGLHRDLYVKFLQAVNTEQAEVHVRTVLGDLTVAAVSNPGISKALEPEEMGRRVNEMLAAFNQVARPAAAKDYLSRLFAAIDAAELEAAVKNVGGGLVEGLFASAGTAKSILRSVSSIVWKLAKGMVGFVTGR